MLAQNKNYAMNILMCFGMTFIVCGHVACGTGISGGSAAVAAGAGINFAFNIFPPASFHVPLFIFVSGYFYKCAHEQKPKEYIKKRLFRLLVPLYLLTFIYAALTAALHKSGFQIGENITLYNIFLDPLFGGHAFRLNMCLWFVAPLFFVQIIDFYIRIIFKVGNSKIKNIIITAIYFVVAFATVCIILKTHGTSGFVEFSSSPEILATRVAFFLPWYALGQLYKTVLEKYDTTQNLLYFAIVIGLQIALLCITKGNVGYVISWCWFYSGRFVPFAATLLGIAFWLRVSKLLAPALANSKTMNYFASNTFSVMAHQFIAFMLVKAIFAALALTGLIHDFDFSAFTSDIWYYYVPSCLLQSASATSAFCTIYVVAGIAVPLGIHMLWDKIKFAALKKQTH